MTVKALTREEWQDRIVWLRDTMPDELERAIRQLEEDNSERLVGLLDEVKAVAQQCAKHLRDSGML